MTKFLDFEISEFRFENQNFTFRFRIYDEVFGFLRFRELVFKVRDSHFSVTGLYTIIRSLCPYQLDSQDSGDQNFRVILFTEQSRKIYKGIEQVKSGVSQDIYLHND